jgi:hypothetical protein
LEFVVKYNGSKGGKIARKSKSPQKGHGGNVVAEKDNGMFDSFNKVSESILSVEGAKKAAAWYIDNSEKFAKQAIELQEKATTWAKETPLAGLFETQTSMARKFVERSAAAARNLWQIQQ